jgi:UDP-perosamine 4-acetyltransferase
MPDGCKGAIVVVGAGGHAKVVIECLRAEGWQVIGCTDVDPTPRHCAGVPVIGTDEILRAIRQDVSYAFCALGDNCLRERRGDDLIALGFEVPAVCGPGCHVSPSARLGRGVAVLPGAVINVESTMGDFAVINTNASIDHDGVIGRGAHIGPGAMLAGNVVVGDRSFVATGSSVIPRMRIGADTLIGAGSVVVSDIPGKVVAYGNPARVQRRL